VIFHRANSPLRLKIVFLLNEKPGLFLSPILRFEQILAREEGLSSRAFYIIAAYAAKS
jgi:hypothetical protein